MKKLLLIGIAFLVAGALYAGQAQAGITGSAHDLKGAGYGTDQICIFCHTPHNAKSPQLAPLWNHTSTTTTFTLYTSPTLNATDLGQPAGASKACLSCHDGTVGIDAYGARAGTVNLTGSALLGTSLADDHPVSFTYNATLATADGGLVTPASTSLVVAGVPLFDSKVECASCHNAHDNALGNFLRVNNTASALCLKCHNK